VLVTVEAWRLTGGTPTPGGDRPRGAWTVLQNVEVLAVADEAQKISASGPGSKAKDKDDRRSQDQYSVVLAVDPDQAQALFLAETGGKIRLALRPFGERDEKPLAPMLEPFALPAARATPTPR
jgi:Flp pilus assembly protein CpaB